MAKLIPNRLCLLSRDRSVAVRQESPSFASVCRDWSDCTKNICIQNEQEAWSHEIIFPSSLREVGFCGVSAQYRTLRINENWSLTLGTQNILFYATPCLNILILQTPKPILVHSEIEKFRRMLIRFVHPLQFTSGTPHYRSIPTQKSPQPGLKTAAEQARG